MVILQVFQTPVSRFCPDGGRLPSLLVGGVSGAWAGVLGVHLVHTDRLGYTLDIFLFR